MASGHVNRTQRPNTWLHRPRLRREESPCQLGAVHTWPQACFRAYSRANRAAKIAGSRLVGIKLGNNVSTAVEWSMLAGATDDEKIANIVRLANEGVDFLLAPADGTELPMHVYGNRFAVEINRRLRDSGEWEKIAGPITISPLENAVVLRNMRRATKSD